MPTRCVDHLYRQNIELFSECYADEGTVIQSGSFNGLTTAEFKKQITDWLQHEGRGARKINYKLRTLALPAGSVIRNWRRSRSCTRSMPRASRRSVIRSA